MWASPRLCLFMELNPIYGFLIPIVSLMRGYIWFGLLRWALNFSSLALWLTGRAILQPAYREACCYGLDYLEEGHVGGKCDEGDLRSDRGFEVCDPEFLSGDHKKCLIAATVLFTVSSCLQVSLDSCMILSIISQILNPGSSIISKIRNPKSSLISKIRNLTPTPFSQLFSESGI